MNQFNIMFKTCFILTVLLPQILSRKYDVDAEALRLYGEDLSSVLRRFRRTPEYLMLLQEKYDNLRMLFEEVTLYAKHFIEETRLKKRVADVCGLQEQSETSPIVRYYKSFRARREGEVPQETQSTTTLSPIEILDSYEPFTSPLSTKERNKIKDIAFETAGQTIHMIIHGMGPSEPRSTRLPFGGEQGEIKITTDRDHRHMISTKGPFEPPEETTTNSPLETGPPIDETLRFLKSKNMLPLH